MQTLLEQALSELKDELTIPTGYQLVEEPGSKYLYLESAGHNKHIMMIMVTDSEFWLYGLYKRGRILLKQLRVECPTLVDEIQATISIAIKSSHQCNHANL